MSKPDAITLQYEWLAPKLSSSERSALDIIYSAYLALRDRLAASEVKGQP